MDSYYHNKLVAFAILLLIIGGLNWGYFAFTGGNFVTYIFGKGAIANAIFIAVFLAAVSLAFYRDTYLPFLGQAIIPCSVLETKEPENADFELKIKTRPGVKVLYWAAEPENKELQTIQNYRQAYLEYRNAGVAIADDTGLAILRVRKPQPYTVPVKGELPAHIHYRVCSGDGFIGPVQTISVDGVEWFENIQEQEQPAPAPVEAEIAAPQPGDPSVAEINTVVRNTEENNLMAQAGGIDESPRTAGYSLEEAYRPAGPSSFVPVNYS